MRYTVVALAVAVLLLSCSSVPSDIGESAADASYPDRVSYLLDSEQSVDMPHVSAAIVSGNVDGIVDWDVAHHQFLEELIYSGIFTSVVLEPENLVDYGAGFSLSELPGNAMQVHVTFVNMHTGDTVYTGVTRGNQKNGNFGFAFIAGTETLYNDAAAVQRALVRSIREYRVRETDITGASVAVLEPLVDGSELPEDDPAVVEAFTSFVDHKFVTMVENLLGDITSANIVDRREVQEGAVASGPAPEFLLSSEVVYDSEGHYLISLKMIDTETNSVFRSAAFAANMWSDETTRFDIGTHIDRMFHSAAAGEDVAGGREPATEPMRGLDIDLRPVFPVFYSYYDKNPIGSATIANNGDVTMENVILSFYVDQYMDNPKASLPIPSIEPGEAACTAVHGLFTSEIMEITEGATLSALVTVTYWDGNQAITEEFVRSIQVLNRNALTWDDDEKIAAFVTARDPAIMGFARTISGIVQQNVQPGINGNLAIAMGLHEGLDSFGMHYVPDPVTSYADYSTRETAVDYLFFPRQTLEFHGGDCDDLSALYCALLEAVGVETAFITTPGHIFAAVSLGMDAADGRRLLAHPDELIFMDDRAWLPVEVTLRNRGFLAAWREGAIQWRENLLRGRAQFYPVHEAWETYQPVGLPGTASLASVDGDDAGRAISLQVTEFVTREIESERTVLEARGEDDPTDPRWPNRLGALYGRYGRYETAVEYFSRALEVEEGYLPAVINMGNVDLQRGNPLEALQYYEAARAIAADDPDVLLSIAMANHQLGNYTATRAAYSKLRQVAPETAGRFAYLELEGEGAGRAAQAGDLGRTILWSDERDEP